MENFLAAAVQFNPRFRQKEENLKKIYTLATEAADQGAKLILFPEMALSGYCFVDRQEIRDQVERVPGPSTDVLAELCRGKSVYIALGLGERDENDDYFNTAALIGPEGYIGKYRKTHLYAPECRWARPGDLGFPVFETALGRIGLAICMDYFFCEPARQLALKGAEVLLNPTNWNDEPCPNWSWISRAWENGCHLLSANRSDEERGVQFMGGSGHIGPDGLPLERLSREEGICYCTMDPASLRWPDLKMDLLSDRVPGKYKDLSLPHQLFPGELYYRLYDIDPIPDLGKGKVGIWQCPGHTSREERLKRALEIIEKGKRDQLDLLVFPENLFIPNISDLASPYEAVDFEREHLFPKLCDALSGSDLHLVLSQIGEADEGLTPGIVLLHQDGVLFRQDRIHLSSLERRWAKPGKQFTCYDLPWCRLGIASGWDSLFPETAMILAGLGADLIAVSAELPGPKPILDDEQVFWHFWRIKANECNCFILAANQELPAMGTSGIFGPCLPYHEEQIAPPLGEAYLTATIDPLLYQKHVRQKENMRQRQVHLYAGLTK